MPRHLWPDVRHGFRMILKHRTQGAPYSERERREVATLRTSSVTGRGPALAHTRRENLVFNLGKSRP